MQMQISRLHARMHADVNRSNFSWPAIFFDMHLCPRYFFQLLALTNLARMKNILASGATNGSFVLI